MRTPTRIVLSAIVTVGCCGAASAQQVAEQYIVASRVLSDVAVGQAAPSGSVLAPTDLPVGTDVPSTTTHPVYPDDAGQSIQSLDGAYDSGSSATGGCAEGGCTSGDDVEQIDAGEVVVDGSGRIIRGGGRLHTLIHGGEVGAHIPKQYAKPDLFYNYYSNGQNRVNAEMYLSPSPVPPFVGNTWIPYQPLMPHNYLYKHVDRYHNHYDYGRGTNRTKAAYFVSPRQYAQTFKNFIRLPR